MAGWCCCKSVAVQPLGLSSFSLQLLTSYSSIFLCTIIMISVSMQYPRFAVILIIQSLLTKCCQATND